MADGNQQQGSEGTQTGADGAGSGAEAAVMFSVDTLKEAGIPDSYLKDGKPDFKAVASSLTEAQTLKAQAAERAAAIPADGKYDFGLPKDWKAPDGAPADLAKNWKIGDDAEVAAYASVAKELGLSQAQVSKFITTRASIAAGRAVAEASAARQAEVEQEARLTTAFGDKASEVVTAAMDWMKANGLSTFLDKNSTETQRISAVLELAKGGKFAPNGSGTGGSETASNPLDKLYPSMAATR